LPAGLRALGRGGGGAGGGGGARRADTAAPPQVAPSQLWENAGPFPSR
jgi:hypothetical protein